MTFWKSCFSQTKLVGKLKGCIVQELLRTFPQGGEIYAHCVVYYFCLRSLEELKYKRDAWDKCRNKQAKTRLSPEDKCKLKLMWLIQIWNLSQWIYNVKLFWRLFYLDTLTDFIWLLKKKKQQKKQPSKVQSCHNQ